MSVTTDAASVRLTMAEVDALDAGPFVAALGHVYDCLLYTSPSPRDS